jgi:hypothetical protein
MSATHSRREQLRDQLVTELTQISVANGYRTDPQLVSRAIVYADEVQNYPTLCVILGDESIQQLDTIRTAFNSVIPVVVLGYYRADTESAGVTKVAGDTAGERLFHDMKRCVGAFILKFVNDTTYPWHVTAKDIQGFAPRLWKENRGECRLEFNVQIQRQDVDF